VLTQSLLDIAEQLAPSVKSWPRRQPGMLMVDSKALRYGDLHSLYYQVRQIFGDGLYEFQSEESAPVILDCGAHIGIASLYFKERYPAAQIRAFEADADLADMCRANLSTFGAGDVIVEQAAVWTHDEGVNFDTTHDDSGHVSTANNGTNVKSVRLKSILDEKPAHLLKLDVEGAEFDILRDCGASLGNASHLIAEVHAMDDQQAKIGELLMLLETLGFRYVLSDLHQATWVPSSQPPPFGVCQTEKFIVTVFAWQPGS
jgi:FkbM family methyltransferase